VEVAGRVVAAEAEAVRVVAAIVAHAAAEIAAIAKK
jgi:hypothetical protein